VRSRYRLPETLRQYGLERLEEAGEKAEFERRHAEHFLALTTSDDWPTRTWWLDARVQAVAPELDNLRAALEWSRKRGRIPREADRRAAQRGRRELDHPRH
jgi:predicted ATPase